MRPRISFQLDLEGFSVLSCPLDAIGPGCSDNVEEMGDIVIGELEEANSIGHV